MGTCLYCGDRLTGLQTKYCSNSCKSMYHRKRAKWNGKCRMCKGPLGESTGVRCNDCRQRHNKRERERRKQWKEEGKCTRCGKERCKGCSSYHK